MNSPLMSIYALTGVNMIFCAIVMGICFCRLAISSKRVILRVRVKFILMGPAAFIFAIAPIWGDIHGWTSVVISGSMAFGLIAESFQWGGSKPPASVQKDTMPAELRENL